MDTQQCDREHVADWVRPDNGLPANEQDVEFVLKGTSSVLTGTFYGATDKIGPRFRAIVLDLKRMPVEVRCWRKSAEVGVLPVEEE